VPALAGGGLLDLDPQRVAYRLHIGHLLQIARRPVVRTQRPLRLKRLRHHLLDQLATDDIAEERGAEQAVGQAGDEGGRHLKDAARPMRPVNGWMNRVHLVNCHRKSTVNPIALDSKLCLPTSSEDHRRSEAQILVSY